MLLKLKKLQLFGAIGVSEGGWGGNLIKSYIAPKSLLYQIHFSPFSLNKI